MTVRLVILGLLHERPMYGYEIKQVIEEHMSDWTSIAFGSIYFALEKMAKEKVVDQIEVEQNSKRPARSVYQINENGREEFLRLLRESWQQPERQYFALDICLFFLHRLPLGEVKQYLIARQTGLQAALQYLEHHRVEQMENPEVPGLAMAIFDHSMVHMQAELRWISGLLEQIEKGVL